MRMNEIRERTDEELGLLAHQIEGDLFKFRVQRHTSQLANPMLLSRSKKTLARVLTVLSARAHGLEKAGAPSTGAPTPAARIAPAAAAPAETTAPKAAKAAAKAAKAPAPSAKPARSAKAPVKSAKPKEAKGRASSKAMTSPKTRKSAPGRSTRGGK